MAALNPRQSALRPSILTGLVVLSTAYHFPLHGASPTYAGADRVVGAPSRLVALAQPSPLTAAEEAHPAALALARRFNPTMAFPIDDVWPVQVRYAWHDGADLVARVEGARGAPARTTVAVANRDLGRIDWSRLPHQAPDGRNIRYYIDAPGDDRLDAALGISGWRHRFRAIAQPRGPGASPTSSPYPPTQYAHVFWWNRARGLLAIQYWFYYPWNEWVNHHEADWEHITVVVAGPTSFDGDGVPDFRVVGHQYFVHDTWLEPTTVVREGGADAREDHALVYVGGRGQLFGWGGSFSGASYPQPGRYPGAGFQPRLLAPDEEVGPPARTIAAQDFQVILLPEPARLDARQRPELSWLRLPFHAGQRHVHVNPPGYQTFGRDHPPVQPGVRDMWLEPPRSAPYAEGLRAPAGDVAGYALAGGL
jgi:hypothetical protein